MAAILTGGEAVATCGPASKPRAWHKKPTGPKPIPSSWLPACVATHAVRTASTQCTAPVARSRHQASLHSAHSPCNPQLPRHQARLLPIKVLAGDAAAQANPGSQVLDINRLINLLERLGSSDQEPDQEWLDMMYAVTASPTTLLTTSQRVRLLVAVASLGLPADEAWIQHMTEVDVSAASSPELLSLWGAMYALEHQPERDWLWCSMQRVAALADQLGGEAAAQAVCLAVELGVLGERPQGEEQGAAGRQAGEEEAKQKLGIWLDAMCLRIVECGLGALDLNLLSELCHTLCSRCRHLAPTEWVDQLMQVSVRQDLSPQHCSRIAVSLAACRALPDLVLPAQLYLITAGCLNELEPDLVADVVWAVATWHVGSEGGQLGKYDLRPPNRWWAEWFQVAGQQLQQSSFTREALLRVVWSMAVLRVRPPAALVKMLVTALQAALVAGSFTPLELLYLTRSADMWYGMLAGVDQAAGSPAQPGVSPLRVQRIAGVEEAYEPPVQLAVLVRDAGQVMGQAVMPPGWRRINTRFPPYCLPARADEAGQEQGVLDELDSAGSGGVEIGGGQVPWQDSLAAQRIYGPLTKPDWR